MLFSVVTSPRQSSGRRRLAVIALATVSGVGLSLSLAACSGSATASSSASGQSIVLYNAQHEQTTNALIAAFTKQTGITVKVDNDDEDVLTAKIEQEGSRSPADVIYTENSNWLQQLANRKLLAKVDPATLAHVPAADSAADGDWVGVSARVSAIVYNSKDLTASQLPTSVMQLAEPQWKGKIEIAPSETDFWPVVSSVDHTYGDAKTLAWLKGLKANAGANDNVPDNETITSDVSKGVAQLGIINHYYYFRLQAEIGKSAVHAGLAFFAPKDAGYLKTISGAAVLKSSKNQAAAQKFVNFITSKAGQSVLEHGESFEYPLAPGVAANPALPALRSLQPNSFSPAQFGTGENAKKLLQEAQLL
jgi:iron(III) transport system substrate-binding protein